MYHSGLRRFLSILICLLMLVSTVGTQAFAETADEAAQTEEQPAETSEEPAQAEESETVSEEAVDAELDTDGDGLFDAYETDVLLSDPFTADGELDFDGDGLGNADEYLLYGTDPTLADTDSDGLTDGGELHLYGTDPTLSDTDYDGLCDGEERNLYNTDPENPDTDNDGLCDGDEIARGTDPLNPDTDGDGILDGDELQLGTNPKKKDRLERVFQSIGKGVLDGALYTDNAAAPTIEGYAPYILYREISVTHEDAESFRGSKALIGKAIRVDLPEGGNLTLKFTLSSTKQAAVFRMTDAGTVLLDGEVDGDTISVSLSESGVYAVMHLKKLYGVLGLDGSETPQTTQNNTYLLDDFRYVTLAAPLKDGDTTDTDGDGIPDCEEIGQSYTIEFGKGKQATVYAFRSDPTLPDSDFDGILDLQDTEPLNGTFHGTYKSGDYQSNVTYTMDYREFFGGNTVYNEDIAGFSVWASQFCYENEDGDTTYKPSSPALTDSNGSTISTVTHIDQLMRAHGMQNVIDYKLENGYSGDGLSLASYSDDDITEVYIGHYPATYNGETIEVVAVYVRGTNGTEKEWCSNFDVGDLNRFDDEYDCVSGKNPRQLNADWTRKTNHRGFDICATRIRRALAAYMEKYLADGAAPVYWFTGHSRGAAIANLLSSYYVDEQNKVFAYTFASPNNTANTEASAAKYDCIFNLVNGDDFVPRLPMPEWGFTRYGRTATFFASTVSSSDRSTYIKKTGYTYASDSSLKELVDKFVVMTKNNAGGIEGWRDVYTYHCYGGTDTDHDEVHQHAGETIGEFRSGSRKDYGSDSNWSNYNEHTKKYSYCVKDKDGGFLGLGNKWSCCQTPAYAMQLLAITMGNLSVSAGISFLTSYDLADRFDFGKLGLIWNYATKIIDPHYMENYYLIQTVLERDGNPETAFNTSASLYTNGGRPAHTHTYTYVTYSDHQPTCTEEGLGYRYCLCSSVSGTYYDDYQKNVKIPALGHDWQTPTWTWTGFTAATATFVCARDGSHTETETDSEITAEIGTGENAGYMVYTATVEHDGETFTDIRRDPIPAYYLTGSISGWTIDESYVFTPSTTTQGEYVLHTTLAVGDEIKVVYGTPGSIQTWYPDGSNNNYTVIADTAGDVTVYFRPAGNSAWSAFNPKDNRGYFYITKDHSIEFEYSPAGSGAATAVSHDVTVTSASVDAPIELTVTPDTGYAFDHIELWKKHGGTAAEQTINGTTFSMPDYDTIVKVYFRLKTYTVVWQNADGTVIATSTAQHGTTPVYSGATPTKAEDAQYTYTFAGWDPEPSPITGDTTFTAVYDAIVKTYLITFVNDDGTVLQSAQVEYGVMPGYTGATPTKAPEGDNIYVFDGWSPTLVTVTQNATYTATFKIRQFGDPVWTWNADYSIATATFTDVADPTYSVSEAAVVTYEDSGATCTEPGTRTYTATVTFHGQEYTDQKTGEAPALGHAWGEPGYEWIGNETGWSVKATVVCANDSTHRIEETVEAVYAIVTEPALNVPGLGRYTATFTDEHFTTQTRDVEIPAILPGDANCDGKVTSADAAALLRATVGLDTLTAQGALNADVNGDGGIDASDAALILRRVVGLIVQFPVEEP